MSYAALFVVAVLACVILNGLTIVVLAKKKQQLTYIDLILISLTVSDLFQAALGYSVEIYSYYSESQMSDTPCKFAGFTVTFLSLVSISHLVAIAIERHVIMKYPIRARGWTKEPVVSLYAIVPSWMYGLLWSVLPLLGWNSYEREEADPHRCGIEITNHESSYISYSYSLLVFCFLLPIVVISFSCYSIYTIVKRMRDQGQRMGMTKHHIVMRAGKKRRQTLMSMVMIGTFLLAWSPYAVCVFVLTANGKVNTGLHSLAALFAKMSTLYNPIIYLIFMRDFRIRFKRLFGCYSNVVTPFETSNTASTGNTSQRKFHSGMSRTETSQVGFQLETSIISKPTGVTETSVISVKPVENHIIESEDVGSARGSVETLRGSRLEHLAEAMSDPPMDKSNKAIDNTPFNDTLVSAPC